MKLGLRAKLVITIEVAVLILFAAAGTTAYFVLKNVFRDNAFSNLSSTDELKVGRILNFMQDVSDELEYVSGNELMRRKIAVLALTGSDENGGVKMFLNEVLKYKTRFVELQVVNLSGEVVMSTSDENTGKIRINDRNFIGSLEKTYVGGFDYDPVAGMAVMMAGTPVKNSKGEVVGVLMGKVNITEVSKLIEDRIGLRKTGESLLVNENNLVLNNLAKEPKQAFKKTVFTPQIERCLAGEVFSVNKVKDYHGDEIHGYYRWVPEIRSCVATKMDSVEVLSGMRKAFLILILLGSVVGTALGLSGWFVGSKMFRPLMLLSGEAQKIKEGNFDVHAEVHSQDEIEEVANSFNEMAVELKKSYSELEDKVKEKTKELEGKLSELETLNDLMVGRELKMVELKEELAKKRKG